MQNDTQISCIYCNSEAVIKHGKTRSGDPRFRCKDCEKTWVKGIVLYKKPDISAVAESYLLGHSIRELVPFYKSSPHRINMKIREFLGETQSWETFLDKSSEVRSADVVYLQGIRFNCSYNSPENNEMFVAFAIEGLSSQIIGFEIAEDNTVDVWTKLIARLSKRKYKVKTFLTRDIKAVENSVTKYFEDSRVKLYLHKLNRDKEVANRCCLLVNASLRDKLIDDALKFYSKLDNQTYTSYLQNRFEMDIKTCIKKDCDRFFECMMKNCGTESESRLEQLLVEFNNRFEKFHALKIDPYMIINAWVGLHMLRPMECGFTRYSLYNQLPCKCSFACFASNHNDEQCEFIPNQRELSDFANEVTIRALHLPIESTVKGKFKLELTSF